jgi:mediator of RNA polymerase II transcription subunit 5
MQHIMTSTKVLRPSLGHPLMKFGMAKSKWPQFLRQCLLQRTSGEEFAGLLTLMYAQSKIAGPALIQLLLKCKTSFCAPNDPLILEYLQTVLSLALVSVSDLLIVLIHQWNKFARTEDSQQNSTKQLEDATCLVTSLIGMIAVNNLTLSIKEAKKSLVLCSRWLSSVAKWISKDPSRASKNTVMAFVESCGMLLVGIASSDVGISVLDDCKSTNPVEHAEPVNSIQKAIYSSLPLLPTASQGLHLRLEAVLRHVSQPRSKDHNDASTQDALNFQNGVIDGPIVASRASLYLYLDSLRCSCGTIDDSRLLSFMNARHSTDHAMMFTDLVAASFDVLQRAHTRERNRQSLDRWCSFVVNKLPALLSVISASSFGSFSTEDTLKTGLQFVNPDFASPYLSRSLSTVKTKFVQVCASYRLLPNSNVSMVVGTPEVDLSHSPALYSKDDLVSQMKSSQSKAAKLLKDLESLDGNAANIAGAVVEVVHGYCQGKETPHLKALATVMLRKPELIDVLSVYVQPDYLLGPLCQLLDDWTWDDLHGEGQPLYEEFGIIMLLIAAFKSRLSLAVSDLTLSRDSSFVSSFLQNANDEYYLDTMSEDVKKHLGEWINALFFSEGLSDDVMSSCSPQDFYRLVPTLLSQSLTACANGKLSIDTLTAGFEYLLEPFLLPALIPAISWLMSTAASRHNQQYVQQLLATLLKEPSSPEAPEIHHTILGIVAAETAAPSGTDIKNQSAGGILASKHAGFTSTVSADIRDLKSSSALTGGVISQVEHAMHALISWASANTTLIGPPRSGCTLLAIALAIYDARFVLRRLASLLLGYYHSIDHASALDLIATAIVCIDEKSTTKCLADALMFEQQNLLPLLKKNETMLAEEIVRLSRRVELLSVVVVQTDLPMDDVVTSLMPGLTEADMQNVQAFPDQSTDMPATQEDVPADIDQMLDAAAAMGNMEQENNNLGANMDDMYLDMDTGDMDLVNFDDLDMEGMF